MGRHPDLSAQADDGTAAAKIASGILSDTEVSVVMRQLPEQVALTRDALGLTSEEAQLLSSLRTGAGLWKVGEHSAFVEHVVAPQEFALIGTNAAMRTTQRGAQR